MNKYLLLNVIFCIILSSTGYAQDSTKTSSGAQLLSHYYAIRDALVAGNSARAVSHAEAFQKTATGIQDKANSETHKKLLKDAGKISGTKDLKKQRESFAGFSINMATLAKSVKLSEKPVYEAYCPMKKASWLTGEKVIKNPYYGSSMLSCGEITGTIE